MRIALIGSDRTELNAVSSELKRLLGLECHLIDDQTDSESIAGVKSDWCILAVPASLMADIDLRREIRRDSILLLLENPSDQSDADFDIVRPYADIALDVGSISTGEIAEEAARSIGEELAIRFSSANTFGEIIRVTTFGESHGPAIGAIMDGVKPGIEISIEEIQAEMDRRRPGQSAVTTPRAETDTVHVLSGMFEGRTTGAPIAMVVYNRDQDPSKYDSIRELFRPGHADFTYYRKYGLRDHRGGGRSSGRETAGRVACGVIARKILSDRGVRIVAHSVEIAGISAKRCELDAIERNKVRCADPDAATRMEAAILKARDENNSVGGIAQIEIHGLPVGLGDPVFFKLDARLTFAVMTLGAVKGVEIGAGFKLARLRGSESNDQMSADGFLSNNAGGITGGISTGQPIVMRAAIKPTSSIARTQRTVDIHGNDREIEVHGRHDPCILPRIIPVLENMAALVILDAWEIQSRIRPGWDG
jgi:chorismate synthase